MNLAHPGAALLLASYLLVVIGIGFGAARRGRASAADFVSGEGSFGPLVLYFVVGATLFSAYALLGTPQRVMAKGSEVTYILAYGALGMVPLFFVGARVRRIGARIGALTQAELCAARFDSRAIAVLMALGSLVAFAPYVVIQLKAASLVVRAVTGWDSAVLAAAPVAFAVGVYVVVGGVRGVGWTNVLQGIAMLAVIWGVGVWMPHRLYGGIPELFDQVIARAPEHLVLPGPAGVSGADYRAEVLVSALGFSVWPHLFMKCFTARDARLVQWTVVSYASFLFFILPLVFLGYVALLEGGPSDDGVLLWLMEAGPLGERPWLFAFVAFAVLAASMSTFDALLHAGASVLVRDLLIGGLGWKLGDRRQAQSMRAGVVVILLGGMAMLGAGERMPVVELLLVGYDFVVQFVPVVYGGLLWRAANRVGALAGLSLGLACVVGLHAAEAWAPGSLEGLGEFGRRPGALALILNTLVFVLASALLRGRPSPRHAAFFPNARAPEPDRNLAQHVDSDAPSQPQQPQQPQQHQQPPAP